MPEMQNISKGLLRLSIIILLPWSVYWGWNYYDAGKKAQEFQEAADFAAERQIGSDSAGNREGREFWLGLVKDNLESRDKAGRREENARNVGMWGGALFLFLVLGGYWTYIGFFSEPTAATSWTVARWRRGANAEDLNAPPPKPQEKTEIAISQEFDLKSEEPSPFDGKRMRKTLYWGVTLFAVTEFVLRSALSGGDKRGTNVLIFLAIGVVAWLIGRLARSETVGAWIFGIISLGFLGLSLSRYVS